MLKQPPGEHERDSCMNGAVNIQKNKICIYVYYYIYTCKYIYIFIYVYIYLGKLSRPQPRSPHFGSRCHSHSDTHLFLIYFVLLHVYRRVYSGLCRAVCDIKCRHTSWLGHHKSSKECRYIYIYLYVFLLLIVSFLYIEVYWQLYLHWYVYLYKL